MITRGRQIIDPLNLYFEDKTAYKIIFCKNTTRWLFGLGYLLYLCNQDRKRMYLNEHNDR